MKNFSKFGFSVVNAGQRNVAVDPKLIVTTTNGNFRVTAPLSKALGLKHGGYAMFINNIAEVDAAIQANNPDVVAFANANGLDLSTYEGRKAVHDEFDVWAIGAGYLMKDKTGTPLKTKERLTKEDKKKIAETQFDEIYASAMASDDEELKAAIEAAQTKEEQIEVLSACVSADEVDRYKGSKLANAAGLTGSELNLNFTDSATYKKLRGDCEDKFNRAYSVDLDDIQTITVNNGYEDVNVQVAILGDYTDEKSGREKAEEGAE